MEMKLKRAVELHSRGDPRQAAALYADILQTEPGHADALHLMGVTETQLGRAESGLALIAKSLAVNPHQPVAISNQGNAYLALDRPAQALASYDRALNLAPDYPLAIFGRGNALAALGRPREALSNFDRALDLVPSFAAALNARGGVLVRSPTGANMPRVRAPFLSASRETIGRTSLFRSWRCAIPRPCSSSAPGSSRHCNRPQRLC
jgi:tetratricopeptide (TPR) repeat protein